MPDQPGVLIARATEVKPRIPRGGRLKATRYPSAVNLVGETVALDYDARGFLLGETALKADYTRGQQYRRVEAMSERGQVTQQRLGNCVRETSVYDPSTGVATTLTSLRTDQSGTAPLDLTTCPATGIAATALVRQDVYLYDRFLNLARQTKNIVGLQREERFAYDELQRLRSSARCTGAGCNPGAAETDTTTYDDLGNLLTKSDYATGYLYGSAARATGNAGPHAVRQITKVGGVTATFAYDANGNLVGGDGRQVDFDLLDRPVRVIAAGTTTDFAYAPGGDRYRQAFYTPTASTFGPKTVYYVGKDFELTVWNTGSSHAGDIEERSFIGGSVVALTTKSALGVIARDLRFQSLDRLGSPVASTGPGLQAALVEAHGFDPWGKPRGGDWLPSAERLHPGGDAGITSARGFTGHEHLDATYLIHMNGRVYDYRLGRFLSVDPIISDPGNPQAVNPYSYLGNNPLSGTDPTGYEPNYGMNDCRFQKCDVVYAGAQFPGQALAAEHSGATPQGQRTSGAAVDEMGPRAVASAPGAEPARKDVFDEIGEWLARKVGDAIKSLLGDLAGKFQPRGLENGAEVETQVEQRVAEGEVRFARDAAHVARESVRALDHVTMVAAPVKGIAGTAARGVGAAARTELQVAERVAGQLADARLGPLAGRISPERLQTLATNPNAMRYLDTASGHTNVVQLVEGRLLRITVADGSRIISVGPIQRNGLFNGVANGRFVPIVE